MTNVSLQSSSSSSASLSASSRNPPSETHQVRSGDTLSSIAKENGTTVAALMRENPQIHNADRIYVGDVITLPSARHGGDETAPSYVTVSAGDTLSRLAREYNTDIATLAHLNGIANPNLIHVGDRLRLPGAGGASTPEVGNTPPAGNANSKSWMDIARRESGTSEIAGARDNARIVQYHQTTTLKATDDETPWCSSFVNWTLEKAGFKGTDSAAAVSWTNWGQKVNGLANGREGDVVVIQNKASGQHHVGFLVRAGDGTFTLLGGNQSNTVKESTYSTASYNVLAVRRPPGSDVAAAAPAETTTATPQRGITEAQYAAVAKDLGVDVAAIKAVADVEATGAGFLDSGKPKVLFEAHKFHAFTNGAYDSSHPNLSSAKWNKALYGAGGEHQHDRLNEARALNDTAALKSASWGRFQIMGFNYEKAGFSNVNDFVDAMKSNEGEHLKAFANFIKSDASLHQALKDHDWADFALRYNGEGYKANQYDTKMADAYAKFAH